MRRNVVWAASALLAASLLFLGLAGPALAGDRAAFNPIGFSEDGRYFAFEEFGVQDGSGFPYSNIYAIDLPEDQWVTGTPFSARLDSSGASLAEARRQAAQLADDTLGRLAITVPADIIALNGDGETDSGKTLRFGTPGYDQPLVGVQNPSTLELQTFVLPATNTSCADYTAESVKGFLLELDWSEIHRDQTLPKSRGCALDYRIYGVVAPFQAGLTPGAVAIISVFPLGFEGLDRRFLAVPLN